MEDLVRAVKIAFASEHSFYVKSHAFHWNVEGSNFPQLHTLFETIYSEVYESIDPFAENIRKLNAYALGSYSAFLKYSVIQEENNILDANSMLASLLGDSEKISKLLKGVFDLAEQYGEHGLSNFIADRQDAHRKHSWMLRSTLKQMQ